MVVNKQGSVKSIKRKARKSRKVTTGRAKEFSYKGYTLEQLQEMSLEELIKILPARARRSLSREMNHDQKKLVEKLEGDYDDIKTHVRDVIILPSYVGKIVEVYNGNSYSKFEIKPEMIGHYLGEFVMTRKEVKHSGPGVGATRSSKFMPLK
ncbi:ribosomal protein small subunit S15 [Thermoplasma volcanium GSS1]|uniref:Small ribosomal subunit protein uS19 n=1 Tax=Thermoplasma volcanium (strain ATCC 51530 / DSM 4299 / JCM 9571 / NBRC 15438 / GSS1) TaxID=273116 RepID=RS19_THEVO|nr:30S ribosomal protein S19 [Thermoplasma volcanium]Q97BX3.1 RecName: Full=Small ribosomal subunit protein uS19; AltName: Full=30S ribosomal protein S19 [Thermoplasma volcanium GSS1]BAB59474.1 ribosomal protein small subunit S15 [Thermoplasma volcanium GSS1]